MSRPIHVALDLMSGDKGPAPIIEAGINCLRRYPELSLTMVGKSEVVAPVSHTYSDLSSRLFVQEAPDVITMDQRPSQVLRSRSRSSMSVALELVRDGVDACVSAGNTGALMLLSRSILKTHPSVDRPAIIKRIPSPDTLTYVVDLGANVDCRAHHLYQFALMGAAMVEAVENRISPTVALLNVGEEETKGNEQVRLASRMLAESPSLNYIGFIEGDALFSNAANVVVCDGFVGNVALKTGEGVGRMMTDLLRKQFSASLYGRLAGVIAAPLLKHLISMLDPSRHNGASLIGLTGTVIKCHGNSRPAGFESGIQQALFEASRNVPEKVHARLDELL